MPKKTNQGLTILVDGDRWVALGEPNLRNTFLYKLLERMGGINESVTNGTYTFDARRRGLRFEVSLLPAE